MSRIQADVLIKPGRGPTLDAVATVDSGAAQTVVGRALAEQAPVLGRATRSVLGGRRIRGTIREVSIRTEPYTCSAVVRAFVPDKPSARVLLGADFLQAVRGRIDFESDRVECRRGAAPKVANGAATKRGRFAAR